MELVVAFLAKRVEGKVYLLKSWALAELSAADVEAWDVVECGREDLEWEGKVVNSGQLIVINIQFFDVSIDRVVEEW